MNRKELISKCQCWIDSNIGTDNKDPKLVSSLIEFVESLGVHTAENAPSHSTRPRLNLDGTRLKWMRDHL